MREEYCALSEIIHPTVCFDKKSFIFASVWIKWFYDCNNFLIEWYRSCALYSPNDKYIVAATLDSTVRLFHRTPKLVAAEAEAVNIHSVQSVNNNSAATGLIRREYKGHLNTKYSLISSTATAEGLNVIVSGSEDGNVLIWDAQSQKEIVKFQTNHGNSFNSQSICYKNSKKTHEKKTFFLFLIKVWYSLSPYVQRVLRIIPHTRDFSR